MIQEELEGEGESVYDKRQSAANPGGRFSIGQLDKGSSTKAHLSRLSNRTLPNQHDSSMSQKSSKSQEVYTPQRHHSTSGDQMDSK